MNLKRFIPLLIILAGVLGVYFTGLHEYLSLEQLKEHRLFLLNYVDENLVLSALIFSGLYILAVALSLPGAAAMMKKAGFRFPRARLSVWRANRL